MKYIDLTLQVGKTNKVYKWAQTQLKKDIVMGHVGTHIDVYNKKQIPLEYMQRRCVVFDVRHVQKRDITTSDIDLEYIRKGDFVLFRTGAIENHPYGSGLYFAKNPYLSWELIDALIDERISFIGIDAPDIRKGQEHIEAEKRCEEGGVYVVENLINVDKINTNEPCKMLTMWHEDPEATGIKCRVIATQP